MEYTQLGKTGITISKVCVGCMSFGKAGTMHDWTLDETESERVIRHALDLGINFFDTANGYSAGTSEEYLGRALKKNAARDKAARRHSATAQRAGLRPERRRSSDEAAPGAAPGTATERRRQPHFPIRTPGTQ